MLEALLIMASETRIKAVAAPQYDALFQTSEGWIGADGDYSIALDKDTVLWLYSDTFVGKVEAGRRIDTVMVNNTVAVQKIGAEKSVEFSYGTDADGNPKALITPDHGKGYFWLWDSALTSKGLFLFLARIEHSDVNPEWPFKMVGMDLTRIENPFDSPKNWRFDAQQRVPFSRFTDEETILFGSATLKPMGPDVFIYGLHGHKDAAGNRHSAMILARVPEDKLGDFSAWRFYSNGTWGTDFEHCDPLFDGTPTEYSVSYMPGIEQYAAVYTEGGIHGHIMVRLAPRPEGPWGPAVNVFDCPDKSWHEKSFSYAAKAHPELSQHPNELLVTYATNSMHFPDLFDDARLYWPRFVKLTFETGDNK